MRKALTGAVAALSMGIFGSVQAADAVKIGVITTLSGGGAVIGEEIKNGAELALQQLQGKIGKLPAELVIVDDQMKPEVGREVATELVRRHKVDFVTGVIWSNVMLAVAPYLIQQKVITVGTVAGPSELAGKMCSPYLFVLSNQTAQAGEVMGRHLQEKGVKDAFLLAPNYAAGRDMLGGFKQNFKGKIASEIYTKLGQPDYQAELSQIRSENPAAVVAFFPGAMGIQFSQQFDQAGLRGRIPLYGMFISDQITVKAQRDAALGNFDVGYWNYDVPGEGSRAFTDAYKAKYGKLPTLYASTTYDAIRMINDTVAQVGKVEDKDALIKAMEKWKSPTRPSFSFNTNHFPIQDYMVLKVEKDGNDYVTKTAAVMKAQKDSFHQECSMGR